jgi:hypothetical protein
MADRWLAALPNNASHVPPGCSAKEKMPLGPCGESGIFFER